MPSIGSAAAMPRVRGSWTVGACFLLAAGVLTAVYATNPENSRGLIAYLAIGLGVGGAILWGTRRYRPTICTGWYLLAAAPPLGGVGMALRRPLAGASNVLISLIPDFITIAAYLLLIAGLFSFLRARRGAGADSALDAGLMGVAALLLSWAMLISPVLATADMPAAYKAINGAYPTISVAVLFLGALIAMTEVRGLFAFWALALAWVGLITGDLVYALASVGTATLPLWVANCAYCAFYGLLGAAGLHPSMVSLGRPAPKRVRGYGGGRFVAVSIALLVPAAVVGLRPPHDADEQIVCGGLVAVLAVLVLIRITGAVNRHATSEVRLEQQANTDPLTGLPNRLRLTAFLEEALGRAHGASRGLGVLFMDLDQFKTVNDNWGHETGDELLTVVARRLSATVRRGELVARVGGDEFVVVCENIDKPEDAVEVARRMLAQLADPVALRSANIPITSSVGVTAARPRTRAVTVEDLLREADTAMYRAKARGGDDVVLFDESMRTEIAARIALERSLRGALERGELQMHYQPIVDLRTGSTTGFEALMRWQHPTMGPVAPDVFIPVAEDTGLIVALGRWAIEESAAQLCRWRSEFGRPLTMSVNLSARQIHDAQLVETVRRALHENGLPGSALCLEVTETTLMDDVEATASTIDALKALGIRLSADDFGTGYSSLAYLRQYPFDEVKVDRSFVNGLGRGGDDDVIVGAVLSMAAALSLATVAEGVETPDQRDRLLDLGAHNAQGWLFSKALPAAQVTAYLRGVPGPRKDAGVSAVASRTVFPLTPTTW
ncbi:MAG: bifunctional diguanylate cyclase/phosphodiesterase [Frankiaceae bacterium]